MKCYFSSIIRCKVQCTLTCNRSEWVQRLVWGVWGSAREGSIRVVNILLVNTDTGGSPGSLMPGFNLTGRAKIGAKAKVRRMNAIESLD